MTPEVSFGGKQRIIGYHVIAVGSKIHDSPLTRDESKLEICFPLLIIPLKKTTLTYGLVIGYGEP